jgi:hypothetical protein
MADIITEFIPEIWSAKILDDKKKKHIYGQLANTDYLDEIRNAGDQVRIPQVGLPTVQSYTRNNFATGLTKENINVASMTLTVDQEKYINLLIDDVDLAQSQPNFMPNVQANSAYQLADSQDSYIAGLYDQAGIKSTSNSAASRVTIGSSNARTELLLMGKEFDEANVQREGRWMVIPPALMFELVDAGILEQSNNDNVWSNGFVANAYGWNVYTSNNVSSTAATSFNIMCGVNRESITLAEQITKVEMGTLQQEGFGVYLKLLHVYGARLISDRTGVIYATVSND